MRITKFGAFVQLEEGIDGLVHISQMSDRHVRRVEDVVEVGKHVQVRVLSVDPEQHRIALSLRITENEPAQREEEASAGFPSAPEKKRKRPLRGGLS